MKKVKEVMRTDIPIVHPEDPIKKVSQMMKDKLTSGVPVIEDARVVGIMTDGDMLSLFYSNVSSYSYEEKMAGGPSGDPFTKRVEEFKQTKVREVMTPQPRTVNENAGVEEAATIFKRFKFKRLIVLNDRGEYVGILERVHVVNSILMS